MAKDIVLDPMVRVLGSVPVRFIIPGERTHWLYLAGALVLVLVLWLRRRHGRPNSPHGKIGLWAFLFPGGHWSHPSAKVDYGYFVVNSILMLALLLPFSLEAAAGSRTAAAGLIELIAPSVAAAPELSVAGIFPWYWTLLATVFSLLLMDAAIFAFHALFHYVGLFWEFHKVHHSAKVLVPFTLYRMHPLELLITAMGLVFIIGLGGGLLALVLDAGAGLPLFTILGVNSFLFAFYLLGYNLRHSHIWLAYPPWLSHILMSPAQHQIHHSCEDRHLDKNLGLIFAFWDWAAGSLYVPHGPEDFELGLVDGEEADYDGVMALYFLPFKKAWRHLAAGPGDGRG